MYWGRPVLQLHVHVRVTIFLPAYCKRSFHFPLIDYGTGTYMYFIYLFVIINVSSSLCLELSATSSASGQSNTPFNTRSCYRAQVDVIFIVKTSRLVNHNRQFENLRDLTVTSRNSAAIDRGDTRALTHLVWCIAETNKSTFDVINAVYDILVR